MPRSARGGARAGRAGTSYANRTDLNNPKVPIATPTNQEYGQAQSQIQSQQAIPISGSPIAAPQLPQAQPQQQASAPLPGLFDPTQHPNEPITAPMTNTNPPLEQAPLMSALSLLASLGDNVSPLVRQYRDYLEAHAQNQVNL